LSAPATVEVQVKMYRKERWRTEHREQRILR
jgi:hypothetical protein